MKNKDQEFAVMRHLLLTFLVKVELLENDSLLCDFIDSLQKSGLDTNQINDLDTFLNGYYNYSQDPSSGSAL